MATWYDIKLATLQKMFSAGATIVNDESTSDYLAAMPYTANEGLQMLATAGKFLTKSITIIHSVVKNILSDETAAKIVQISNGTYEYVGDGAKSYYFEVTGKGTATITVGDSTTIIEIDSKSDFTEYRGLLTNTDDEQVSITFASDYPMSIRNVALYLDTFETAEEVPAYRKRYYYNMKELTDDFYQIDPKGIYYEGDYDSYLQTSEFWQEGTSTLILPRDHEGSYTIYYRAYPTEINTTTEETYELPLDPEVLAILPLYMASQLYKDDDNGIATSYRNEFEVAFDRLRNSANRYAKEDFVSESGWI